MEEFRSFDGNLEFGYDEKGRFYKRMKEKYKKSYEKAKKDKLDCHFGMSIWQKTVKMAQSTLFCGPFVSFFTKLLSLSCVLLIVMYILLYFSNVVFNV